MGLEKFIIVEKEKIDARKLAEATGFAYSYVRAVISGRIQPGRKLATALEKVTDGEIKASDLVSPKKDARIERKNKRALSIVKQLIENGEIKKTDLFPKKPVESVLPTVEID